MKSVTAVIALLGLLMGCNPGSQIPYDQVQQEFLADYPRATVVSIIPEAESSARGLLGYAVNLTITFKRDGSSEEERVVWLYRHEDGSWLVKNKKGITSAGESSLSHDTGAKLSSADEDLSRSTVQSDASPGFRKVQVASYTFEVPIDWEMGGQAEEQRMLQLIEVDPRYKISDLSTFSSSGDGCIITVYAILLPTSEQESYLDKLEKQNAEKFRIGMSQGFVKQVFESRRRTWEGVKALLLDYEMSRGDLPRHRQWVLQRGQMPRNILVVIACCSSQGHSTTMEDIDRIASSIRPMGKS